MKFFRTVRDYFCYCGISKDEYNAIKKEAYVSNFAVWRLLHILMSAVFTFLFVNSLFNNLLTQNMVFYLVAMIYSILATLLFFFVLKKDSLLAQLMIYLSISMLFLFGCFITSNKPSTPATTFIVFLLITPIFMIDKPYFMCLEMTVATAVFLVWMYFVKEYATWQIDLVNVLVFLFVGIFIHIISNSVRIKEFVLTRKINIQKDTDELTGLKNRSAITREINAHINNQNKNKGIFMLLDIDRFKAINDTYGHDVGDIVLTLLGQFLATKFVNGEVVGRFGGDEFVIFIKDNNEVEYAMQMASEIVSGAASSITYPGQEEPISVSVGIALYSGQEKNYSEIFKNADIAMYEAKAKPDHNISLFRKE